MIVQSIKKLRSLLTQKLLPASSYFFTGKVNRTTEPLSSRYGYDRGTPIDRLYIEDFLAKNSSVIKGTCLEIVDDTYTSKFGKEQVEKSEILDIRPENKRATLYGDLKNLENVPSNSFDCLIITQTFGQIDEPVLAAQECYRILKPNGVLLATFPCLGKVEFEDAQFWRFSKASVKYVFGKAFGKENLTLETYGNSLVCQAFLAGFAQEDLTAEELSTKDPVYPLIVTLKAVKK